MYSLTGHAHNLPRWLKWVRVFLRPGRRNDISDTIRTEYHAMGKLSADEVKTLVIVFLILLNFMLETRTGLNAAHVMVVLGFGFHITQAKEKQDHSHFIGEQIHLQPHLKAHHPALNIWIIFFVTGALSVGICSGPSGFGALAEETLLPILTRSI